MLFSLLLATLDRVGDVDHCLASLARQTVQDFEVLLIDQNEDNRLVPLVERYRSLMRIEHLRCEKGHSRAFNFGMERAQGQILAFPDYDCWYDNDLLERVATQLTEHPHALGVTGREVVEAGFVSGGRWDSVAGPVNHANVWRRAITFTIFLRRDVASQYRFDETLGVGAGTQWGAGEESDFLLRLIEDGHSIHYDPSVTVWHRGRSGPYTPELYRKARNYGRGMGRVLAKRRYGFASVAGHLIRPAGGTLLSLVQGRLAKARYHWSIFQGRTAGWWHPVDAREQARTAPRALASSREDLA